METKGLISGAVAGAITALLITKDGEKKQANVSPVTNNGSAVTPARDGVDGKDGVNGTDGIDGKDGVDGKDGADGTNGTNGTDGKDGTNGIDGKDGVDGKDGIDGKDGKDGVDFSYDTSAITPEDGDVVYYEVAPGFAVALYRVS